MNKLPEVDAIVARMSSPSPDGTGASNPQDTQANKKPFHFKLQLVPVYTARENLTSWIRYCIIILERLKLVKQVDTKCHSL
ncbi:hypothetical protein ES705_38265 [subsurface metagenome]